MILSRLTHFKKVVIAVVSVIALSPTDSTLAASDLFATVASTSHGENKQLLAQNPTSEAVDTDSTTTIEGETVTTTTTSVKREKSGFTLYIWQPGGTISEVIARISIKGKHGDKYYQERFLGDYKYKIKQKAKFVNGFKLGDRIVVRLYDNKNRLIGYTEFACLPEHTAVNLVLSANPTEYQVVRVFYGTDNNEDSIVDRDATIAYDYFTELKNQKVTFLESSENINITQYQAAGFSNVAKTSVYPASFSEGDFALAGKTISITDAKLAKALTANPGSLVELTQLSKDSTFPLNQLLSKYRSVGVAKGIQVTFSDISKDYWAKDYIAELAAMEIIDGYPDGTFRPNAPVTRAQLAALLQKTFIKSKIRNAIAFRDVPKDYWAYDAIRETYEMGFFTILNSKNFNPSQKLTRLDVLITLAKGLNYKFTGSTKDILSIYSDASSIRSEHRDFIAALTQNGVIVNYPNIKLLNGKKTATRAEVCALLYRAMVSAGEAADFASKYTIQPVIKGDR
ncbi:S-layer homology domain-containing protein [Sphaerospermopsis aphanizomenoides BCCUSP55]|uniref:S-layer homology domain-containing protein n=1 Tax=Sphaerospermopsis aphanizomenoides TaxID=459663 RepID=UPI000A8967F8|nr:S-layer homology domain-containing protein [Sphaerospermopsis aphanizomenoides]MBK1986614.1 S-layer homology domain-containing protein [Sphaerospermopsis aphanizomenoides BCCUSP55]